MRASLPYRAPLLLFLLLCLAPAGCVEEDVDAPVLALAASSRLSIDGLDCSRITKVEGLAFPDHPASAGPTTLFVSMPASAAQPFVDWLEASKLAPPQRRDGTFEEGEATWILKGLEIRKASKKDAASNVVVELYLEQMKLQQG